MSIYNNPRKLTPANLVRHVVTLLVICPKVCGKNADTTTEAKRTRTGVLREFFGMNMASAGKIGGKSVSQM